MKKITHFLLLMLVSVTMWAQYQEPVKFSVEQKKISDSEIELIFTGTVDPGWHVYSTDIADGGPTAATITFETKEGVKPAGKLTPKGKVLTKHDALFDMQVSYMEGKAVFSQKLKITAPQYKVSGYLTTLYLSLIHI